LLLFAGFGLGEPAAAEFCFGDTGKIRLEIEDRSAVEHVDAADVEIGAVATKQFNGGESDRIRAERRAGGEDSVRTVVGGRIGDKVETLGAIKFPDDDEVREAFDVGEAGGEFREDFEDAVGGVLGAEAFWYVGRLFVGAGDEADGARGEHLKNVKPWEILKRRDEANRRRGRSFVGQECPTHANLKTSIAGRRNGVILALSWKAGSYKMRKQILLPIFLSLTVLTHLHAQQEHQHSKRIGLALSGGGALGLAHIGVLKYFEEKRIPVDLVAGTSMGGLVGGLFASGQSTEELNRVVHNIVWDDIFRWTPRFEDRPVIEKQEWNRVTGEVTVRFGKNLSLPAGINPGQQLALLLSRETIGYADDQNFDDLPTPFRCVATDLVTGESFVPDHGPLAKAMRATMALPAVFTPVEWGNKVLIDGGLVNNLPTDVVREMGAELVIAVMLETDPVDSKKLNTLTNVLKQSVAIAVLQNERRNAKLADLVINAQLGSAGLLDFDRADEIIREGYEAAQRAGKDLEKFSVTEEEWGKYLQARRERMKTSPVSGALVEVKSEQPEIQKNGARELERKSRGGTTESELEKNLTGLTASTGLPSAFYNWRFKEKPGYVVELEPRPNREMLLRPSLFDQWSAGEPNRFALRLEASGMTQNAYKTRFLTELLLGYDPGARFEYYHAFDGTAYFMAPGAIAERMHIASYEGRQRTDFYRDRTGGSFYFGAGTWRYVQARLGFRAGYDSYSSLITVDGVKAKDSGFVDPEFVAIINSQDSGELPKQGSRVNSTLGWSFRNHSYPYMKLDFDHFEPVTRNFSAFILGTSDSSFGRKLTFYDQFTSGGLTSMDAFHYQEFHANTLVQLGGGGMYRGWNPRDLQFRPYFAAWYQGGRFDVGSKGWETHHSTSAGIFAPTPLGLAGMSVGFDEEGRARFRLSLGSFWNRP
jgi:NTE family protein